MKQNKWGNFFSQVSILISSTHWTNTVWECWFIYGCHRIPVLFVRRLSVVSSCFRSTMGHGSGMGQRTSAMGIRSSGIGARGSSIGIRGSGIGVRSRSDVPKDPRPVSDKSYQHRCVRILIEASFISLFLFTCHFSWFFVFYFHLKLFACQFVSCFVSVQNCLRCLSLPSAAPPPPTLSRTPASPPPPLFVCKINLCVTISFKPVCMIKC